MARVRYVFAIIIGLSHYLTWLEKISSLEFRYTRYNLNIYSYLIFSRVEKRRWFTSVSIVQNPFPVVTI